MLGNLTLRKSFFGNFQKKMKGETSAIYVDQERNRQRSSPQPLTYQQPPASVSYYPPSYIAVVAPTYPQAPNPTYPEYPQTFTLGYHPNQVAPPCQHAPIAQNYQQPRPHAPHNALVNQNVTEEGQILILFLCHTENCIHPCCREV